MILLTNTLKNNRVLYRLWVQNYLALSYSFKQKQIIVLALTVLRWLVEERVRRKVGDGDGDVDRVP
jgi:hypothetical protein